MLMQLATNHLGIMCMAAEHLETENSKGTRVTRAIGELAPHGVTSLGSDHMCAHTVKSMNSIFPWDLPKRSKAYSSEMNMQCLTHCTSEMKCHHGQHCLALPCNAGNETRSAHLLAPSSSGCHHSLHEDR